MSGNKLWSAKIGAKLLSDLVIFSILSFEMPLDFHESMWVLLLKYLMYFSAGINTELFSIVHLIHFCLNCLVYYQNLSFLWK